MLLVKLMSVLLLPLPLCVGILLVGLFLLCFTQKQTAGKAVVFGGVAMLLLLGNPAFSNKLLRPLEHQYPRLVLPSDPQTNREARAARYIVVLGEDGSSDSRAGISNQPREDSLVRLVEGIRLYKQLGGRKLILSGGPGRYSSPMALYMATAARGLGVRRQDIILESESEGSEEQAHLVAMIVGNKPFILVTSASRMSQAMALFKKVGANPLAAPAGYWSTPSQALGPEDLCPTSDGLGKAERAVHEYMGLAWGTLREDVKIFSGAESQPAE
jgi:uncharacterized SAM-binding protein YcdF (DUF218 family)